MADRDWGRAKLFVTCDPETDDPTGTVSFYLTGDGDLRVETRQYEPNAKFPEQSEIHLNSLTLRRKSSGVNQPQSLRDWIDEVIK